MPVLWVQRKASLPSVARLKPTTTLPSFDTPLGCEEKVPPGRSPIGVKVAALSGRHRRRRGERESPKRSLLPGISCGVPAGGFAW